jgi:DNA-binding HxlR family transcriptional regulator
MSVVHHKAPRPMGTVTVAKESASPKATAVVGRLAAGSLPASCPLREPEAMAAYKQAVRAGSELSIHSQRFLAARTPKEMGDWLARLMDVSRDVFQPWSMEILFVIGVLGQVRFGQLEDLLGASSRTLSNKLRTLAKAGLLERKVEPGPPVRISYSLTKSGGATGALSSPLFAHLNLAALGLA